MSKIISFANRKGGTGKSTLLMLTATAYKSRTNKKVLVIDADSQGSVMGTRSLEGDNKKGFDLVKFNWNHSAANDRFKKLITEADKKYDVIFIDPPGKLEGKEVEFTILYSDVICVPLVARPVDLQSTISFLEAIRPVIDARAKQGFTTTLLGIPNKLDRTLEVQYIKNLQGKHGMYVMDKGLSDRIRYARELSTYTSIVESYKKDEFNEYYNDFIILTGL